MEQFSVSHLVEQLHNDKRLDKSGTVLGITFSPWNSFIMTIKRLDKSGTVLDITF